jgi:hypothetical protein
MDGDNVELAGNWVNFGGTVELNDLDMGDGGELDVKPGQAPVRASSRRHQCPDRHRVRAGQLWVEDYHDDDQLDIDVDGGRFANTGFFDGLLDMHVTDGQALLGVDDAVMELAPAA